VRSCEKQSSVPRKATRPRSVPIEGRVAKPARSHEARSPCQRTLPAAERHCQAYRDWRPASSVSAWRCVCAESSLSSGRKRLGTARCRRKEESESQRAVTGPEVGVRVTRHHRQASPPSPHRMADSVVGINVAGAYSCKAAYCRAEGVPSALSIGGRKSRENHKPSRHGKQRRRSSSLLL
jgi:hypothetical protein